MSERQPIRVCIIYPTDPLGVSPGGIDPFHSRHPSLGAGRYAIQHGRRNDLNRNCVRSMSGQPARSARAAFEFLPILKFEDSGTQKRIPLTVRFVLALLRKRSEVAADVLEFHRIEPSPCHFFGRHLPMTVVIHQNMQILKNRDSDIRWKYLPGPVFQARGLHHGAHGLDFLRA